MNKRKLMIKAHKIAKSIVAIVGDYMVAMKIALKQAWGEVKMLKVSTAKNGSEYVQLEEGALKTGGKVITEEHKNAGKKGMSRKERRAAYVSVAVERVIEGCGEPFEADGVWMQRFYLAAK